MPPPRRWERHGIRSQEGKGRCKEEDAREEQNRPRDRKERKNER